MMGRIAQREVAAPARFRLEVRIAGERAGKETVEVEESRLRNAFAIVRGNRKAAAQLSLERSTERGRILEPGEDIVADRQSGADWPKVGHPPLGRQRLM